jgi:hypothetical protein
MPEFAGPAAGAGEPNTPEFELGELNWSPLEVGSITNV